MKKLIFAFFLMCLCVSTLMAQKRLSQDDRAKLTPEQRIVYDNSFKRKGGKRKEVSVEKKVKHAKKEDRKSRRIKQPKNRILKKK